MWKTEKIAFSYVVTMTWWRHCVLNRHFKNWGGKSKTQNYENWPLWLFNLGVTLPRIFGFESDSKKFQIPKKYIIPIALVPFLPKKLVPGLSGAKKKKIGFPGWLWFWPDYSKKWNEPMCKLPPLGEVWMHLGLPFLAHFELTSVAWGQNVDFGIWTDIRSPREANVSDFFEFSNFGRNAHGFVKEPILPDDLPTS